MLNSLQADRLHIRTNRNSKPSLFTVDASAGAVGLTVWYPEQMLENVKPYPYTFYVEGNDDSMLHTIKDCTLNVDVQKEVQGEFYFFCLKGNVAQCIII